MGDSKTTCDREIAPGLSDGQKPAIRFLIESALRTVTTGKAKSNPSNRQEWVAYLAEALMADSDAPYQSVLTSLMANGVSSDEIFQKYIPDTARYLGELWVSDQASFMDVTAGAARLQSLFRTRDANSTSAWMSRSIPLGHSVLMVLPDFEDHSLGAFVAADDLRHHGLWVHMSIALDASEIVELLNANRFSMVGMSLATMESVDKCADLVDFLREKAELLPPVVVGGRAVDGNEDAIIRAGADFVATSAKEAIELCGLPSVARVPEFTAIGREMIAKQESD